MGKEISKESIIKLINAAKAKLPDSYAPYSKFHVAAALLDANGNIHTGVNIENASYGLCNCAERTAIFSAVKEGVRDFKAICIMGTPEEGLPGVANGQPLKDYCPPCGACRQVMGEFCKGDFEIILARSEEDYKVFTLDDLLPERFEL